MYYTFKNKDDTLIYSALKILQTGLSFFIVLFLSIERTYSQQWNLIGPPGGNVTNIAVDSKFPAIVYATSEAGIFKTTDGGTTAKLLKGANSYVLIDPVNTNILYSGNKKSTDQGETWRQLQWSVVAINPVNSNHIYYSAISPDSILRQLRVSYNGGERWTILCNFQTGLGLLNIAKTDANIFYGVSHDSGTGVYKSTNAGYTWIKTSFQLPQGEEIKCITINPINPQIVFVGTNTFVNKTIDGGNTWKRILTTACVQGISINPVDTSIVYVVTGSYAGCVGRVIKTTNSGNSWAIKTSGLPVLELYIYAIAQNPLNPDELYVGSYAFGVFKTINGAQNWQMSNISHVPVLDIYFHPFNPGHLYAGTNNEGILKTANYGKSWMMLDFAKPRILKYFSEYAVNLKNPDIHYTAGGYNGLFKSVTTGISWASTALTSVEQALTLRIAIHPTNAETLYTSLLGYMDRNLYRSTDGGITFENIYDDIAVDKIQFDPLNPSIIYVCGSESGILKSENDGQNWFWINNGLIRIDPPPYSNYAPVSGMDIDRSNTNILYLCQAAYGSSIRGGLLKSTNAGQSWFRIDSTIDTMDINLNFQDIKISPRNPSYLIAASKAYGQNQTYSHGGVYRSIDAGATWTQIRNVSSWEIEFDPFDPYKIYVATTNGIYTLSDSLLVSTKEPGEMIIPTKIVLKQNYPNPFNPSTKISWQSQVSSRQVVKVFDVLGNEVATLVDEYKPAGSYEVEFTATRRLASGIYFYQLKVGEYVTAKKMILLH